MEIKLSTSTEITLLVLMAFYAGIHNSPIACALCIVLVLIGCCYLSKEDK